MLLLVAKDTWEIPKEKGKTHLSASSTSAKIKRSELIVQVELTRICAEQLLAVQHCQSSQSQREILVARATGYSHHHLD